MTASPVTTVALTRHWTVNARATSRADWDQARRSEDVSDHPPVPAAALSTLRRHLVGPSTRDPRITWHHRDGNAWAAVMDLHRHADDETATALAVLLRWCEARGSHDDHTIWSLTPARPEESQ